MSKSNNFETGWLKLVFQNDATDTTIAAIGSGLRNAVTAAILRQPSYGGRGRGWHAADQRGDLHLVCAVAVARTVGGWTVAANEVSNAAGDCIPGCGRSATRSRISPSGRISGTGYVLYKGQLTTPLVVATGITPKFAIGDLDVTEDWKWPPPRALRSTGPAARLRCRSSSMARGSTLDYQTPAEAYYVWNFGEPANEHNIIHGAGVYNAAHAYESAGAYTAR